MREVVLAEVKSQVDKLLLKEVALKLSRQKSSIKVSHPIETEKYKAP